MQAKVLEAVAAAFAATTGPHVSIRAIADRLRTLDGIDSGSAISNKWVGFIVRKHLRLETLKTGGIYVVPKHQRMKVKTLCDRYKIEASDIS